MVYHGVTYGCDLSNKVLLESKFVNNESVCVLEPSENDDESREEHHVYIFWGGDAKFSGYSPDRWYAIYEVIGSEDDLRRSKQEDFDTKSEAVVQALKWAYEEKPVAAVAAQGANSVVMHAGH